VTFPAQLEDGTTIDVTKVYEGDTIVLKDADGNRYSQAQFGAHIKPLADDETQPTAAQTDTEPVPEEDEPTGGDALGDAIQGAVSAVENGAAESETEPETGGEEEAGEGGANDEPIG
jgi:hypothetical protein